MNKVMIQNWNSVIKDDDVVYHLGDFSIDSYGKQKNIEKEKELRKIYNRLRGKKFLIYGNHDIVFLDLYRDLFIEVLPYKEIQIEKKIFTLCHYPMEEWNGSHKGFGIHLHGHCHGKSTVKQNRLDVGVDCHNFFPVNLQEILKKINNKS
jgi:calcineurin-like phosphoesterase family protein